MDDDLAALEAIAGNAFVPTMGALHRGHLALIERARAFDRPVLVSVFVNPTQCGPGEDFERYPRTLPADVAAAEAAGASVVFAPSRETIYPPEGDITAPPLPEVATKPGLEDACRPGHFAGVCQVVARLFDLVQPSVAVFGEKDYQQLLTIRAMVDAASGRWGNLKIVGHPTVREPGGLALSSRNAYLSPPQREQALGLSRALHAAKAGPAPPAAEDAMHQILDEHRLQVDYAVVRDAETLMPVSSFERPARALIAARLGSVRLIDNAPVD